MDMSKQRYASPAAPWSKMIPGFLALLMITFSPGVGSAGMNRMTDTELSAVVGQGFSSFTMVNGTALADFSGISAATYTEIDSVKLGYWDKSGGSNKGWDQNWTAVKLGSSASDLTLNGFYLKAQFDPATIGDPANRKLTGISIGSNDVTGVISANFQSFNGTINGTDYSRAPLGNASYQLNHSPLAFSVELSGPHAGVWVNMGTATKL